MPCRCVIVVARNSKDTGLAIQKHPILMPDLSPEKSMMGAIFVETHTLGPFRRLAELVAVVGPRAARHRSGPRFSIISSPGAP